MRVRRVDDGHRCSMKPFGELGPAERARRLGIVMLSVIALVLVIFLVITMMVGDPTDHLEERQPSPSPETASSPAG